MKKIAIFGTGYVGLVSGACLAQVGNRVTCVDVDAEKIAQIRSLASTTIMGHLATWYTVGGNFRIDEYLDVAEEVEVRKILPQIKNTDFLKPIKSKLPEYISYETIRLVIAKVGREELRVYLKSFNY